MKIDCGLSPETRRQRAVQAEKDRREALQKWHRWFAWRPVRLGDHDCRWLEHVERLGVRDYFPGEDGPYYRWAWTYRALREKA